MIQNKRSYILNASSAYLSFLFDLLLKIFVLKFVLIHLGPELLGVWGILKAAALFPLFLQDGLSSAIFLQTARSRDENKPWEESLLLSLLFGLLTGGAVFSFAPFLSGFFHIPDSFQTEGILAFRLTGLVLLLTSIAQAFLSFHQGSGRFHVAAILVSGTSLLNSLAAMILLQKGFGIVALVMIDLITISLLILGASYAWFRIHRFLPFFFSKATFSSLLKESAGQMTLKASGRILWESDALFISRLFGVLPLAHYWIARRIPYAWKDLIWSGAMPAAPATALDSSEPQKRLMKIHFFQAMLLLPVSAYLFFFAPAIITVWVGQEYTTTSVLWMRILVLAVTIDLYPAALFYFLLGRSRIANMTRITFGAALLKLCLSIFAIAAGSLKILLLSTVAGALFFCIGALLATARENHRNALSLLLPLAVSLPASAIGGFCAHFVQGQLSLLLLILQAAIFCAVAYSLSLIFLRVLSPGLWKELRVPFCNRPSSASSESHPAPIRFL